MKKLFTFFSAFLLTASMFAQSPEKMSYQAVIRDASDNLITDTQVGMQISILQGSESGTAVYAETQEPTTNANGLVSIEIGTGATSDDFSAIDWADGPYYIKTETDPEGGTNYTITVTSQLLSVPYALHAITADSVSGTINETDPIFTDSEAANITETDITNLGNLSGTNTGDQDISGIDTNEQAIKDTASQIRADVPDVPSGTQTGEMQYWDGSEWITVDAGDEGQVLTFTDDKPTWKTQEEDIGEVENPATGEIWMDKNLGASRFATSSTDAAAYGDLYQWGRAADGHESRTSDTTSDLSTDFTLVHDDFIIATESPYDWRDPQNDDLWQGVDGTNNPCPDGYRLPTGAEWEDEVDSWDSEDATGAFDSPLSLPLAGWRDRSDGSLSNVGSGGFYWSSTVNGTESAYLNLASYGTGMFSAGRANGYSVRCIKD